MMLAFCALSLLGVEAFTGAAEGTCAAKMCASASECGDGCLCCQGLYCCAAEDALADLYHSTASAVSARKVDAAAPPAVDVLDVSKYTGRWFQMYGSATVQWTFEAGGNCVTADYGKTARADLVSVTNTVRVLGFPVKVSGYAVANPAHAGELDVSLGPGKDPSQAGSFSSENYRVFELGPERDGMYDYALVSDPSATSLYVLARNVSRFEALYDAQVLQTLERRGFTGFLTRPRKTKQTECEYTPPPQ